MKIYNKPKPPSPREKMEKIIMESTQNFVNKDWGYEVWFANTDEYCGKLLYVKQDYWSSNGKFHYHDVKDETFYVISGILELEWYDEENDCHNILLKKGDSFRILPGIKHRFRAITEEGCEFIEASTTHRDEDSYRCEFIDGTWVE